MGFSKSLNGNRRQTMPEDIDLKEISYTHIKTFIGKKKAFPIPVKGFFISKGDYGLGVTLVCEVDGEVTGVNIPSWYTDRFKDASDEDVEQILEGRLIITAVEETKTKNGKTYQITFEDV